MEVVCGCCRWCREPVRRSEGRYAAADGAVVHEVHGGIPAGGAGAAAAGGTGRIPV